MDIGIPLEILDQERRVAMSPAGVHRLVQDGHRVFVQRGAGEGSRWADREYEAAGAHLAYSGEEAFHRADLVVKVAAPARQEFDALREGQALLCFLRPAVAPRSGFETLVSRRIAAVAMEWIEDDDGRMPVREAISEIAGPMAIHVGAHLLQSSSGGRGILLAGAPGIPPANVVILGAGRLGISAARTALGSGAQVLILDTDIRKLRRVGELFWNRASTLLADEYHVSRAVRFADVLIGAVAVWGERTPHVVTETMVRTMKPGAVILDLAIDHGGCVETSRPTTFGQPTFVHGDVVHFAVPNMTADVARTASAALANAVLAYVREIAARGLVTAAAADPGLARAVVTYDGRCLHASIAEHFGAPYAAPRDAMGVAENSNERR